MDENALKLHAALWFFGSPMGMHPGTFGEHLLKAMSSADTANRDRLALAFPEYAVPFIMGRDYPWGIETLERAAHTATPHGVPMDAAWLDGVARRVRRSRRADG